jgi:ATP-dependent exoDNAse (exonuclease V) alpha subunit
VEALIKGCQSPEALTLKDGATVIFTRNDPEGRFVNGTTGVVAGARGNDGWPVVQLTGADGKPGALVTAEPVTWEMVEQTDEQALDTAALLHGKTSIADPRTEKRILARISQVPLRLAWGITVHKSQGMSLDAAVMDLSRTFEYGQGYVALSRVRSLGGLHLLGWNYRALQVHPKVLSKDSEFRAASEALYDRAELRRPGYSTLS